jgi:NAD+ diphosphatase
MNFIPEVSAPETPTKEITWIAFINNEVLVKVEDDKVYFPCLSAEKALNDKTTYKQYLGKLEGNDCFAAELNNRQDIPEGFVFASMRSLLGVADMEIFSLIGKAFQILSWDVNNRFCGRCGTETTQKTGERAKICPKCGLVIYPRISPAIIVSVVKDGKILLANARRFKSNMYSILAGFTEAGETFEECVRREIKEEVNINVKNITYFGSQPWPFPDSLMTAFKAEYDSGELKADGDEILHADWFSYDELPPVPGKWSIARRLIDAFVEEQKKAFKPELLQS